MGLSFPIRNFKIDHQKSSKIVYMIIVVLKECVAS